MKFQSICLIAALEVAFASELHRCGTYEPDAKMRADLESAYAKGAGKRSGQIVVDTYVNIVTTTGKQGRYSPDQVEKQIATMNDAYSPMGVTFNTISVNFTANDDWAAAGMSSTVETEMKQALHQGSYADLNLYFLSDMPDGLLGFCYFPVGDPSAADRTLDGCMNLADSLPDGSATNYNLGMTAVHETGHWFGLYHTFQGSSCEGAGDSVADTPMQSTPSTGCPAKKDSCPDQPGLDSIHNYMDYSYDECLYDFTDGQIDRALSIYDQYRAGK